MERKEHLTENGLQEIVNIKASHNLGLSDMLKEAFPNTEAVHRPRVKDQKIPHPQWVSGFVSGEGCFYANISKSSTSKVGFNVRLRFILSQDVRDEQLMESLVTYFNCGRLEKTKEGMVYLVVTKFLDNYDNIIPFFIKHQIEGVKHLDFKDWVQIAEIIKTKAHLDTEGANLILKISTGMNKQR
jgi:hypothetical protein